MIDHLEGCVISTAVAGCTGLPCCSSSRPPLPAESKMATAVVLVRYLGPCCRQPPITKISLRRSKRKAEVPIHAWGDGLTWCRSMMVWAVHKCDSMMAWAVHTNATAAVKRGRRPRVCDEDEKFQQGTLASRHLDGVLTRRRTGWASLSRCTEITRTTAAWCRLRMTFESTVVRRRRLFIDRDNFLEWLWKLEGTRPPANYHAWDIEWEGYQPSLRTIE
jgi:hypothetical protein